jgi:hypothetical protein
MEDGGSDEEELRKMENAWVLCGEVQTVGTASLASNRITALRAAKKHVLVVSYVCDTVMLR